MSFELMYCKEPLSRKIRQVSFNIVKYSLYSLVLSAKGKKKPVIVSGCVPQGDRNIKGLEDVSVIGVTQIDRVVEVVEEALKGHNVKLLAKKDLPILDLPKIRKN